MLALLSYTFEAGRQWLPQSRYLRQEEHMGCVTWTSLRLAVGVLFETALIGCGQTSTPSGSASMPPPTPAGPALHIGVTSDGFLFNTPARMCHVPLLVVGTVSADGTSYWNTPNGARQADVTSAVV